MSIVSNESPRDDTHYGAALTSLDVDGDGRLELVIGADEQAIGSGFVEIIWLGDVDLTGGHGGNKTLEVL